MNRNSLDAAEKAFGKVRQVLCSKSDFREIMRAIEREATLAKVEQPDEKSVVGAVNALLEEAIRSNASDIHIEPMRDRVRIRFRLDGVLVHHKDLPLQMGPPLTSRLKIMAKAGVGDLGQVGYLLYETRGTTTLIGIDREPGPLMRDGLSAAGYRHVAEPVERHVCQRRRIQADGAR